jgi:hypothetical protein
VAPEHLADTLKHRQASLGQPGAAPSMHVLAAIIDPNTNEMAWPTTRLNQLQELLA